MKLNSFNILLIISIILILLKSRFEKLFNIIKHYYIIKFFYL